MLLIIGGVRLLFYHCFGFVTVICNLVNTSFSLFLILSFSFRTYQISSLYEQIEWNINHRCLTERFFLEWYPRSVYQRVWRLRPNCCNIVSPAPSTPTPTKSPTLQPTAKPTFQPTGHPTPAPTTSPTTPSILDVNSVLIQYWAQWLVPIRAATESFGFIHLRKALWPKKRLAPKLLEEMSISTYVEPVIHNYTKRIEREISVHFLKRNEVCFFLIEPSQWNKLMYYLLEVDWTLKETNKRGCDINYLNNSQQRHSFVW